MWFGYLGLMGERRGDERRVVDLLQQGFEPQETKGEISLTLIGESGEVESSGKALALARDVDKPSRRCARDLQRSDQLLHQLPIECIKLVGPVKPDPHHGAVAIDAKTIRREILGHIHQSFWFISLF